VAADRSQVFSLDVDSGRLTRVTKEPSALAKSRSNLDVLADAVRAATTSG
jgi:hypothetical protein